MLASRHRGRKSYRHPKGLVGVERRWLLPGEGAAVVPETEEALAAFAWEEQEPDILCAHGLDDVNAEPKDSLRTNNRCAANPTPDP